MVALLVAMAVSAVWMAAALPAWRQQSIREKEAELIFRGESIARAIYLYRQERGGALPPDIETLVEQRFLRRHYLDPITGEEFMPVAGATSVGGGIGGGGLQAGIIGVRSRSNETSIRIYNDQQTYSQWAFDFTLEQMRAGGGLPAAIPDGGRGGPPIGGRGGRRGGSPDGFDPITPPGLGPGRGGRGQF